MIPPPLPGITYVQDGRFLTPNAGRRSFAYFITNRFLTDEQALATPQYAASPPAIKIANLPNPRSRLLQLIASAAAVSFVSVAIWLAVRSREQLRIQVAAVNNETKENQNMNSKRKIALAFAIAAVASAVTITTIRAATCNNKAPSSTTANVNCKSGCTTSLSDGTSCSYQTETLGPHDIFCNCSISQQCVEGGGSRVTARIKVYSGTCSSGACNGVTL